MSQFSGPAATSVLIGVLAVGVPIVTSFVSNSGTFYFYILPIFGFISGVRAVSRGLVIGGIVGIVLNILGGLTSLVASGILFR